MHSKKKFKPLSSVIKWSNTIAACSMECPYYVNLIHSFWNFLAKLTDQLDLTDSNVFLILEWIITCICFMLALPFLSLYWPYCRCRFRDIGLTTDQQEGITICTCLKNISWRCSGRKESFWHRVIVYLCTNSISKLNSMLTTSLIVATYSLKQVILLNGLIQIWLILGVDI